MTQSTWTWEDYDTLRNKYPDMGRDIQQLFPDVSMENILKRVERLNTHLHTPYTDEEKRIAKEYGPALGTALIFLIPGRTLGEITELL